MFMNFKTRILRNILLTSFVACCALVGSRIGAQGYVDGVFPPPGQGSTTLTVQLSAPSSGAQLSGQSNLLASAIDTTGTVSHVSFNYLVSGDTVATAIGPATSNGDGTYSAVWDTTGVPDGSYELFATAINSLSQVVDSAHVSVSVKNNTSGGGGDNIVPMGSMISPADDYLVTDAVTLSAQAEDNNGGSGIASVSFYLDGDSTPLGVVTAKDSSGRYSLNWNVSGLGLADGIHNVFAVIADRSENEYETPAVSFRTDTTLPTGTISYSTTAKTRNNVTATISNFNRPVTITNNDGASTYTFTDNGTLTFSFTDSVGHTGTAVATVANIDRTAPQFSGFVPADGSSVNGNTQFRFTDTKRTSPRCSTDGLNYSGCGSLAFKDINGFNNLPQGPFVLYVKDLDSLGNLGTAAPTFIKDTIAPTLVSATVTDARTVVAKFSEGLGTVSASNFQVNSIVPVSFEESDGLVTLHFDRDIVSGTSPSGSLVVNQTGISDLAGNNMSDASSSILLDGIDPIISLATTFSPSSFTLNFSESLKDSYKIDASDLSAYAVRNGSVIFLPIDSISVAGQSINVNVTSTMYRGDNIYFTVLNSHDFSDESGNQFNNGSAFTGVVNNNLTNIAPAGTIGGGGAGAGAPGARAGIGSVAGSSTGSVLGITYFRFTKDLKFGQTNADVKELQIRLTQKGFMVSAPLSTYFGTKTLAGVKKYQKAHNLPQTGFVGAMTRDSLNGKTDIVGQIAAIMEKIASLKKMLAEMQAH